MLRLGTYENGELRCGGQQRELVALAVNLVFQLGMILLVTWLLDCAHYRALRICIWSAMRAVPWLGALSRQSALPEHMGMTAFGSQ